MTSAAAVVKMIEEIVEGPGTNSHRARELFKLGCDRSDVVELLGMTYSQAHSIWKKEGHGEEDSGIRPTGGPIRASVPDTRPDDHVAAPRVSRGRRSPLRLSPSQTRFITQDGHVIVRVDQESGPICKKCKQKVQFSIVYLGFIHSGSTTEPTDLEDRYYD